MAENILVFDSSDEPAHTEVARAQIQNGWRNLDWLELNWSKILPQARGKFVAVAGRESHLADSADEAWAWAKSAHPNDDGAIVQYVRPEQGPRIYAHQWQMEKVR